MANRVLASAAVTAVLPLLRFYRYCGSTVTAVLLGIVASLAVFLMANSGSAVPNAPITAQNLLAGTSSTATAQGPPVSDEYVTVRTQDFGVWSYSATRSDMDPLHASVNYKHDTVADLKAYAEANKALLPQVVKLGGIAEVTVNFALPVSEDWFSNWVRVNHFQVDSAQGMGVFHVYGTADEPLTKDELANLTTNAGGVFGAYGSVDASRLAQLWTYPDTFLVDVTPAWVRYDVAQSGIKEPLRGRVQVALPFGWMERMGIHNFTDLSLPTPQTTFEPIILSPAPDEP
ncbi:MAG: hypothetical protein ABJA50_00530 [Chloroflexota bacterium]